VCSAQQGKGPGVACSYPVKRLQRRSSGHPSPRLGVSQRAPWADEFYNQLSFGGAYSSVAAQRIFGRQ
jgi:hypothetical protein